MNVYGILNGRLVCSGKLSGELSSPATLSGSLTVPSTAGIVAYDGEYEVTPTAYETQTLATQNKFMLDDVTVLAVPYYQTSNVSGDTVFIASEVNDGN